MGFTLPVNDVLHRLGHQVGTQHHQPVVHVLHIVIGPDGHPLLLYHLAGVYLVVQEEGGDARLAVSVDDGPVDGGGSAVLRQQGGVQIECSQARHGPHRLGQHAEGHHYLQVGPQAAQLGQEGFVLQTFGLQNGDAVLQRALLHGRGLQLALVPPYGLVRHGDDPHHIVAFVYQSLQCGHCKVGRAHVYYPQVFFLHWLYYVDMVSMRKVTKKPLENKA